MSQFLRDDFDRLHDYNCLIKQRIVFFGSEYIDDDCGGESGVEFLSSGKLIKNLLYLDHKRKAPITLHYSSPGGDWDRGIAIHDCIKGLRSGVRFVGYGCVRSMGSVIIQACGARYLTPNCRFMIHDGYAGFFGTGEDFQRTAKEYQNISNKMYEIYFKQMKKKNKKITIEEIAEMCQHDCYMSGEQAVSLGLADKVLK